MKKVLYLIPTADYGSASTQLGLLAPTLPRERFACRVCVLGRDGPLVSVLQTAGVEVDILGWTRLLDGRPLWRLRQLIRSFQPDFVHVWRPAALRALALAGAGRWRTWHRAAIVVSAPLTPPQTTSWRALDRWLLGQAHQIVATGQAEAEACRGAGARVLQLATVPVGIESRAGSGAPAALGPVPNPQAPTVACIGPLEAHKGFYDALWTFDILRYLYNDLQLLMIGAGTERERLQQFVRNIGATSQVRWLGQPDDVRPFLRIADVIWVPSRGAGGIHAALEAMAEGKAVVASRLPCLAEIVADGTTGFLVPPGDRVALARQTRLLFDDEPRRRRMGLAGQQRVQAQFTAAAMTRRFADLYESLRSA
jgi:glycosyltransferase involved in cell wall biosynthesis